MSDRPPTGESGSIPGVRDQILELAAGRREARRAAEAFFDQPGWLRLKEAEFDLSLTDRDRQMAGRILGEYGEYTARIVAALPALHESRNSFEDTAIDERFGAFLTYPNLRNLDLWRRVHRAEGEPDWEAADTLELGLELLLDELGSVVAENPYGGAINYRYSCIPYDSTPDNCDMVLQHLPSTAEEQIAYLYRNTNKALVIDTITGDVISIGKRTEFTVRLDLLEEDDKEAMMRKLELWRNEFNLGWAPQTHKRMERLITALRYTAIRPVYTTLFSYREHMPSNASVLLTPQQLEDYPELQARIFRPIVLSQDPVGMAEDARYRESLRRIKGES